MESNRLTQIIHKITVENHSGTLLCVDIDETLGRIYFVSGKAITARYSNSHGNEALNLVSQMQPKSIKFHNNRDMVLSKIVITDAEPNAGHSTEPPKTNISPRPNNKANTRPKKPQRKRFASINVANHAPLTPELIAILSEELADIMGPAAKFLVGDLDDSFSLEKAIDYLASEIDGDALAQQFIHSVRQSLPG